MAIRVIGLVGHPRVLTGEDLDAMRGRSPTASRSGETASPVAAVLASADPDPTATYCTVVADDGYRASIPLTALRDHGWLSVEPDAPHPTGQGGTYRLTVEDGATLCWNVKRVAELRVTADPEPDDVPADPTH